MKYAVYSSDSGQIEKIISCAPDQVQIQVLTGQGFIELDSESVSDASHYVCDGQLVAFPSAPSALHTWDWSLKEWAGPPLDVLRAEQWLKIKEARAEAESAGVTVGEYTFDSDPASQSKVQGAMQLTQYVPDDWTVDWTLADNTVITLSKNGLIALALSLGSHVQDVYAKARDLRLAIDSASTAEEILAVCW